MRNTLLDHIRGKLMSIEILARGLKPRRIEDLLGEV